VRLFIILMAILGLSISFSGQASACERKDIKPMSFDGVIAPPNCRGAATCSRWISKIFNVPNINDDGFSVRRKTIRRSPLCLLGALKDADGKLPRKFRKVDQQSRERLQAIIDKDGLKTPLDKLYAEIMGLDGNERIRLLGLQDGEENQLLPAAYRWVEPLSDRYVWVWDLDRRNRIIDLETGESKPFPGWDTYGFRGANVRYQVGPDRTSLYLLPMNQRDDRYDLAVIGPRGEPEAVLLDLRGKWKDHDTGNDISVLVLNSGVIMFFGWDGDNKPITYRFKRGEALTAMPGGLDYMPILNRYAERESDHGYLLLRPVGLMQPDIGTGSKVYYESYDPVTLEVQTLNDPDYLGVIPVLPTTAGSAEPGAGQVYYRHVLFVFQRNNPNGTERYPYIYDYKIVNGAKSDYDGSEAYDPSPLRIFQVAPDYEKIDGVWLPEQPTKQNRVLLKKGGTWTSWPRNDTLRGDIKTLAIDPDIRGGTKLAAMRAADAKEANDRRLAEIQRKQFEANMAFEAQRRREARQRAEEQWARQEEERRRRNQGSSKSVFQQMLDAQNNARKNGGCACFYNNGRYTCEAYCRYD